MSYAAYQNAQAVRASSSSVGPSNYSAGSGGGAGGAARAGAGMVMGMGMEPAATTSVPDVPGQIVLEDRAEMLRRHVAKLCNLSHNRFPGAQPVSFTKASLELLKSQDFWVCEKSDGQRVLVLIAWNKAQGCQEVFLINRKNVYREQTRSLFFPSHERTTPNDEKAVDGGRWKARSETLLDGELVWDTLPDGRRKMRLLLFDCLVIDGTNMASRMLLKRYGRLKELLYKPYADYMMRHQTQAREIGYECAS
ncbi:mrna capping alpha subunit [Ceraceosorus bombacis]|uniref:Mrna capping alpha subunit n=1 Tax=Ceraceosorus bombacis TaxID=401625 RepID=A0A0P1BH09_9BASI|nr:mrna capping alpha subunit [Ceraceosorus bombacis]